MERELRFSKHSGVIAAFGREFAKEDDGLKEFHRGLADAQDARAIGDYQAEASISGEEVEAHLERAERFLRAGV